MSEFTDRLKRRFSPADFKVPFTTATQILRKIERHFIRVKDLREDYHLLAQHCSHWADNLKNKAALQTIPLTRLSQVSDRLAPAVNYWIVLARRQHPMVKHVLFDTKPNAMQPLLTRHADDFFIVDKRYGWLVYCQVDKVAGTMHIFKSGDATTPFDRE